jgi:DNA-binding NtrC family response regulator
VDDDAAFLRSAKVLLTHRGHRVSTFRAASVAAWFFQPDAPVDVLILDYVLGEWTGSDLLRRVRSLLPATCKVILISGHTDRVEGRDLDELGVCGFLPKPLDFDRLCELAGSNLDISGIVVHGASRHPEIDEKSVLAKLCRINCL